MTITEIKLPFAKDGTEFATAELVLADAAARERLDTQWTSWWAKARTRFTEPDRIPAYFVEPKWKLGRLCEEVAFPRGARELHIVEVIEGEPRTQGVLVTTRPGDLIRGRPVLNEGLKAKGISGEDMLWVEYIAIAPWLLEDDAKRVEVQRLGVGSALMKVAIQLARQTTRDKHVGLHAQGALAEDTYRRRWKMLEDGNDPDEKPERAPEDHPGYLVFAFDDERANIFLTKQK